VFVFSLETYFRALCWWCW